MKQSISPTIDILGPSSVVLIHHELPPGAGGKAAVSSWSMSLTLAGRCRSFFPEGMPDLEAGDWILVGPGVLQHWIVPTEERDGTPLPNPHWILFSAFFQARPHWIEFVKQLEIWPGVYRLRLQGRCYQEVRRSLACALRALQQGDPHREQWTQLYIERALLRLYDEQGSAHREIDGRVRRAVEFIHRNLGRHLTLEEIAAAGYISVSHLLELFKTQMNASPMAYVEQVRMRRAQEMLKYTFYPVAQIATLVGYEQPSYFVQRFHKSVGLTPLAYRKQSKEKPLDDGD